MALITKANMIELFGESELTQLTDQETKAGVINDSVLNRAMANAEDIANSYISAAYELPLTVETPVLIPIVCDIARYRLYDEAASEQVTTRFKDAIAWLTKLAQGSVKLAVPSVSAPDSSVVVVKSRSQVFTDAIISQMDVR